MTVHVQFKQTDIATSLGNLDIGFPKKSENSENTEIRYLQLSGAVPSNSILEMKIAGRGCRKY